jgi:GNAT superfamily N-acetyltransferase
VRSAELAPFAEEHLAGAAALLADAHARHRVTEPLLADSDAPRWVEQAWRSDDVSGAVALRGGRVAGYLLGRAAMSRQWGRHVFVDRAGHAAEDAELVRDLFTSAATRWWDAGVRRFFAVVPSLPERLDPWTRLGFAQMHQDAARETADGPASVEGIDVRRGGVEDVDLALRVDALIGATQERSPSFAPHVPHTRSDWVETLAEPEVAYFVAERDGRPLGHSTLYPADPGFATPADAVFVASTATVPEARGTGAGLALVANALAWARAEGYGTIWTNWRVTNLAASRFWPARGFRPTYTRLVREPGIG